MSGRIEIHPIARQHGITDAETRCVVEYPFLVVGDFEAQVATDASLFVGRADENEPLVEVLGELDDEGETIVVFHAMYLTTGTVRTAGMGSFVGPGDLAGKQRK